MAGYQVRVFSLPAELENQLTAELWALGALGFEVRQADAGRVCLDAYFPASHPTPELDPERWRHLGLESLGFEELEDRDWLESYRASAEPFDVGERFRIDPGDPAGAEPAATAPLGNRHLLRIPARTAFGTGSHESTRLVLEWLEDLDLTGLAVLDYGVGSGILSLAARVLGARRVVGFDVDAQAVCIARGNARLNGLETAFFAGGIDALCPETLFELALVNILPENFEGEIPRLKRTLRPGARVLSSGNLASRRVELLDRWRRRGFTLESERRQDEWSAFLLSLL